MNEDRAYQELTKYSAEVDKYLQEELSEADTRAKFVDVFMKNVLGWREEDIRRERTYWNEDKRAALDYEVGVGKPLFVVEAKRQRQDFELPNPERYQLLYRLNGLVQSRPNLWAAIEQARKYCDDTGIPYGLVTNGRQFALFKAIVVGQSWRSGSVAVFDIQTLQRRCFAKVVAALHAAKSNPHTLDQLLEVGPSVLEAQRIADSVGPQVGRLSNEMTDVMEQTIAIVLRDHPNPDRKFLEECYSLDQTTKYYAKSIESLLQDPIPLFASAISSVRPGHKKDPFARAIAANVARAGLRPPLLLIGGKGFGKTTFLHWFLKASEFRNKLRGSIVVWVDFKEAGYEAALVNSQVRKDLVNQLENSSALSISGFDALKEVFKDKLNDEKKKTLGPFLSDNQILDQKIADLISRWQADTHVYLGFLIRYATQHCGKKILVVLDNADQKDQEFQFAVHDVAQQLCTSFPVTLVLALRENTYFKLSKSPRGDAFSQQQVFHIRAPKLEPVLRNRFAYLAKHLKTTELKITSAAGYSLTIANIDQFLQFLRRSLLDSSHSPDILELLVSISNGSVRDSLKLIHEFLVSGHTKMEDYFWGYASRSTSNIPFHEFLASVLLDEMAFFTEQNSHFFLNIFGRTGDPSDSHFCRLRILSLVERISTGNSFRPEDYVLLKVLHSRFSQAGIPRPVIDAHLQALIRFGLLQTNTQTDLSEDASRQEEFDYVSSVHIAAAGKYYKNKLASSFQYCLRIIPDTPIFNKEHFARIDAVFAPFKTRNLDVPLDKAMETVEIFLAYLVEQENQEHRQTALSRDDVLCTLSFTPRMSEKIGAKLDHIRKVL